MGVSQDPAPQRKKPGPKPGSRRPGYWAISDAFAESKTRPEWWTGSGSGRPAHQHPQERQRREADNSRDGRVDLDSNNPAYLPQDTNAERALIDAVLLDNTVIDRCGKVKPGWFFRHQNQILWATFLEMRAKGEPIDPITLMDALRTKGKLEDAGGEVDVFALGNSVPHSEHAEHYARIVCEKYALRKSLYNNSQLAGVAGRGDVQELSSAWALQAVEMQEVFAALGITADGSTGRGPRHQLKTLTEMRARPRPEWIIPGVLQERKRSLIFGDSNTGKSFLAIDMALALATGLPWHGKSTKQGTVIYVCAEGGDGITTRVDAWLEYHGLRDVESFWLVDDSPNLLELGDVSGLITQINQTLDEPPALVIFDTLAASMPGGDENGALDMGVVIGAIHRVQRECDCGVMVVHHTGKDPTKGPRGNSSLRADVDLALEVSMDEQSGMVAMRGNKMRDADKTKVNLAFRLHERTLASNPYLTSCIVEALDEPPLPDPQRVRRKLTATDKLALLMQETGERRLYSQWLRLWNERGEGSKAAFDRALNALYHAKRVDNHNGLYGLVEDAASQGGENTANL